MVRGRMPTRTVFLNVDLDLRSEVELGCLLTALAPDTVLLRHEGGHAVLELGDPAHRSMESTLAALWTLIERLPADARAVWAQCTTRVFDAGFESVLVPGDSGQVYEGLVSPGTLRRIAGLDAGLLVTVYPSAGGTSRPQAPRRRRRATGGT